MKQETLVLLDPNKSHIDVRSIDKSQELDDFGLYCPYGKDFLCYEKIVPYALLGTHWLFVVKNKQKFLLAVLKYNLNATYI